MTLMQAAETPVSGRPAASCGLHVGVFDSGVGGLSVLRALCAEMPSARFTYFADSLHAPYGEREATHVRERSLAAAGLLLDRGAQAIVVACNTATALAVDAIRRRWPGTVVVGVEPGVKPAAARSVVRRVGVLATPATLASERFAALVAAHAGDCQVVVQPCPGLAGRIEQGALDAPDLAELVRGFCRPLRDAGIDVAVLGCTHYAFVRSSIAASLGAEIAIVDTAEAVAREAARRCASAGLWSPPASSRSGRRPAMPMLLTNSPIAGPREALARLACGWLRGALHLERVVEASSFISTEAVSGTVDV